MNKNITEKINSKALEHSDKLKGTPKQKSDAFYNYLVGAEFGFYLTTEENKERDLIMELGRLKRALDLALYYMNDDSIWENLKIKIHKILKGDD